MRRILGSNLPAALQVQAKAMFVHRFTGDHKPDWTQGSPLQFASDADWLAHTLFWVTKRNTLAKRASCESSPTWPYNPELRR